MRDLFVVSEIASVQLIELLLPEHLDSTEFDQLNTSLLHLFDNKVKARWLIDLAHVQHMGSNVLGVMVNVRQRAKESQGQLVLCNLSPRLRTIFQACCLERLFTLARSRDEGLAALR